MTSLKYFYLKHITLAIIYDHSLYRGGAIAGYSVRLSISRIISTCTTLRVRARSIDVYACTALSSHVLDRNIYFIN